MRSEGKMFRYVAYVFRSNVYTDGTSKLINHDARSDGRKQKETREEENAIPYEPQEIRKRTRERNNSTPPYVIPRLFVNNNDHEVSEPSYGYRKRNHPY